MKLIVGLGNPGAAYRETRHNIGFRVVERIAEKLKLGLASGKGPYQVALGRFRSREVALMQPTTFMNLSGEAVGGFARRNRIVPADVLVVVDDLHLAVGRLRLRQGGSAGGHNGLISLTEHLKTDAYARLRLGVGSDFGPGQQSRYVLEPFPVAETEVVEAMVVRAVEAALVFITDGLTTAMNRFNERESPKTTAGSSS